jgi:hypothetical protein
MIPNRVIAGLILVAPLAGLCGCGAYHHGILPPRDYGAIGTTPHCVAPRLVGDPLFYGHRPTRWRQWPSDYITWRYSIPDCQVPTDEQVLVVPETESPPKEEDTQGEELPAASDPFESSDPDPDESSEFGIDRLPQAPAEAKFAKLNETTSADPASPPEPREVEVNELLNASE